VKTITANGREKNKKQQLVVWGLLQKQPVTLDGHYYSTKSNKQVAENKER
jgi:hypothetical protein